MEEQLRMGRLLTEGAEVMVMPAMDYVVLMEVEV
jgi:hypothetical protein